MSIDTTLLKGDQALIAGVAKGSTAALKQIYEEFFPSILHYVIKNNGSSDDAKDVFQEAIMVLFDKASQPDFELSSKLQTYLYSVSRFIWLKKLKQSKGDFISFDPSLEETLALEEDIEDSEKKEKQFSLMEESLNLLGEPCQTIIQDFYMKGKSMQAICDKLGYTNANNAKTQKYKCLQRLKKLYFSYEG